MRRLSEWGSGGGGGAELRQAEDLADGLSKPCAGRWGGAGGPKTPPFRVRQSAGTINSCGHDDEAGFCIQNGTVCEAVSVACLRLSLETPPGGEPATSSVWELQVSSRVVGLVVPDCGCRLVAQHFFP